MRILSKKVKRVKIFIETNILSNSWFKSLLDYLTLINILLSQLTKGKYRIYTLRDELKFKVRQRTADLYVLREIFFSNLYTPKNFAIKKTDNVIDIGAHIGIFSIVASHLAKEGKVFSFEPNKENYSLLQENIKLNHSKNIIPHNIAVSNKDGQKRLMLDKSINTGGHSFFKGINNLTGKSVIVKTISLKKIVDKYKLKKVDFLKIDCEGAEYDILFNAPSEVFDKIEKISMEYHNINNKYNSSALKLFLEKKRVYCYN